MKITQKKNKNINEHDAHFIYDGQSKTKAWIIFSVAHNQRATIRNSTTTTTKKKCVSKWS